MIPGLLREITWWAVPPVVGAVIGWVTNDIAIRMLFRPLKEVRVFGVRLPFTPGIFPRERRTLARSIGRMVSRELITEDALSRQVHSPRAQEALAKSVSSLSARILDTPVASLSAAGAGLLAGSLEDLLREALAGFFSSRTLIYVVRDVVGRAVASLSGRKLRELLAGFDLGSFVKERLLPLLAGEQARRAIGKAAVNGLEEQAGSILSDDLLASLANAVQPLVPSAVDRLGRWLRSAAMKRELEERGRELLSRILEKLNLVQRFLLSAGQFDRRLEEKMPEIVEETISSLEKLARDPARQQAALEALVQAAREWRSSRGAPGRQAAKPRSEAGERLSGVLAELIDGFLAGLADEKAREKTWAAIEGAFAGGGDPSVGTFALRTLGIREEEVVEYLSTKILAYLSRPEAAGHVSRELAGLAGRFLEDHGTTPLGSLLRIDGDRKQKLDAFLLSRGVALIDEKLPEILAGVDVEQLVVEKIDGLSVRDVERLLLQVIASHLKWINVFGAILGFLIGLLQDLLRLLRLG